MTGPSLIIEQSLFSEATMIKSTPNISLPHSNS